MLNSTDFFNTSAFNAPIRQFGIKVELLSGSSTLDTFRGSDRVKTLSVDRTGVNDKFIGFGICQKLTLELLDKERELNITDSNSFKSYFTANENSEELCPFPLFNAYDINRDENSNDIKVIAYDLLYKASKYKVSDLTLEPPYSLNDFLNACGALLGVNVVLSGSISDAVINYSYEQGANFDGTETLREALDAAAEMLLSIYYINSYNELVFKSLDKEGEAVLTIEKSSYFTLKTKPISVLSKITHTTELGDNITASSGVDGATQYFRNNPFLELREDAAEVLDAAISVIGGLALAPFNLDWRGNFLLELGDKIELVTKDDNTASSFLLNDQLKYDGGFKQVSYFEFDSSEAESAENPTQLGEAVKATYAKVDKANKKIELLVSESAENKSRLSQLEVTTEGISGSVQAIESMASESIAELNEELTEVKKTANASLTEEQATLLFKEELSKGTEKVETSTGYTFDANGLRISKSGSNIETAITEDGMQVFKDGEAVLTANNSGVQAKDLHATTYLIIGKNSRFEDYELDGESRTGCFWIGG